MEVIKQVYESNFGTACQTYKEAVKLDSGVRLQDVKGYLSKRDDLQVESKPEAYNSFVSPGSEFELEIDIMDMGSKDAASNARYGFVAIDKFTKRAEVVPIKSRTPEAMIDGSKKIFTSMGKPKQLYADEESSVRFAKMVEFINQTEIKSVQTSTHAHAVGRFY